MSSARHRGQAVAIPNDRLVATPRALCCMFSMTAFLSPIVPVRLAAGCNVWYFCVSLRCRVARSCASHDERVCLGTHAHAAISSVKCHACHADALTPVGKSAPSCAAMLMAGLGGQALAVCTETSSACSAHLCNISSIDCHIGVLTVSRQHGMSRHSRVAKICAHICDVPVTGGSTSVPLYGQQTGSPRPNSGDPYEAT